MQVLGGLLKDPSRLSETDRYKLENSDFPERFHTIIFAAINNLYKNGTVQIDEIEIDGFLSQYDMQYEVFNQNNGVEYLQNIQEIFKEGNFDYFYERLKKFTLLREMDGLGFDVSSIYDNTLMNPREQEELLVQFDRMTIADILRVYESKMIEVRDLFESDSEARGIHAGDGVEELIDRMKNSPDIGLPLNSGMLTDASRGARMKKFYLRSAPTGFGKSRNLVADSCRLSAIGWYDSETESWVENEFDVASVIISTEMMFDELQPIALAYIADVDEEKIQEGTMTEEEEERVYYAANILKNSKIYMEQLPNFNVEDIERTIEKNIIQNDVEYVMFDYIHSSIEILSGFTRNSGISLREDQILFLMADKLKAICNKHDVFLISSTQLNDGWKEASRKGEEIDQSFIRGSKAVVDKVDFASILLPMSKKEKEEIKPILENRFQKEPNFVSHIFKNRGNRYNNIKIYSYINMGTMRIEDLFATNIENELIIIRELEIHSKE